MKFITAIILFISAGNLPGQSNVTDEESIPYSIHLTTMNDNMLKGMLLQVKDSSITIYPGKPKEWKKNTKYMTVEFGYHNIRELLLKGKNGSWKKYAINGSVPLFNEFKKLAK